MSTEEEALYDRVWHQKPDKEICHKKLKRSFAMIAV